MTELWRLSATELAFLIRTRKVSAREVAEAALQRLDAVNPQINAIVAHRPELVLAQAKRVDQTIARGEDPGPLAGVPMTGQHGSGGIRHHKRDLAAKRPCGAAQQPGG
jgi:amidase